MKLPTQPAKYDASFEQQRSGIIERALAQTVEDVRNIPATDSEGLAAAVAAAEAAAASAIGAETAALLAQTGAETAEDNAVIAQTAAETASSSAGTYATAASSSATGAAGSASAASISASAAAASESAAAGSASAASTSASTASTHATNAGTYASAASASATNASTSASDASGYASTALTYRNDASTSATNAAGSASTATTQAGVATTAAGEAGTSASAAASSASSASSSASSASGYATAAATALTEVEATIRGTSLGLPLEQWTLNGQSIVVVSDGKVGTSALRLDGAGGYPNQGNFVPLDPTKKYRVKFWARPSADCTGSLYFNLRQSIDTSGSNWGPTNVGRSPYKPSGVSRATHLSNYGDTWGEYSYLWDATDWQAGVKYLQPEFLDNYTDATGHWDVQAFTFTDATDIETVSASVTTEASARASADGDLFAQYTVKVDTNGYVSGYGLANTVVTGTPTSTFTILVDNFKVVTPGVSAVSPFYISGGVVYMQNVVIGNALISDLTVTKLTTGTLNADINAGTGKVIFDNGTNKRVMGVGFGTSSAFTDWYGPSGTAVGSISESGAAFYIKTDGSAYFNGVLGSTAIGSIYGLSLSLDAGTLTSNGANGARSYGSRTVTATGGSGSYTYEWAIATQRQTESPPTAGDGFYITSGSTTATIGVSGNATDNLLTGRIVCTVTDSAGRVGTIGFSVSAGHGTY